MNAASSTEEVFTRIYRQGEWGGALNDGGLCSGEGSAATATVDPYVERVEALFKTLGLEGTRVVDLGCGDFRVGRRLTHLAGSYVGVDIVEHLVAHHRKEFGTDSVSFVHANLITDPLPEGTVCFVRQVLQHLSSDQVAAILPRLEAYRFAIITEHYPSKAHLVKPNIDQVHGAGMRCSAGSGLYLDQAPFGISSARLLPVLEVKSVELGNVPDSGVIRTYLLAPEDEAEAVQDQLGAAGLLLKQLA